MDRFRHIPGAGALFTDEQDRRLIAGDLAHILLHFLRLFASRVELFHRKLGDKASLIQFLVKLCIHFYDTAAFLEGEYGPLDPVVNADRRNIDNNLHFVAVDENRVALFTIHQRLVERFPAQARYDLLHSFSNRISQVAFQKIAAAAVDPANDPVVIHLHNACKGIVEHYVDLCIIGLRELNRIRNPLGRLQRFAQAFYSCRDLIIRKA